MGIKKLDENVARASGIPIRLADPSENGRDNIQIFRAGHYYHSWYGEFTLTKKVFQNMIRNYKQDVLKIDLMLDYNHRVEEAAAWFHKLYLKQGDDGAWELWAEIEFTEDGKSDIEKKKYRYISGDFHFNHVDNESNEEFGPTLFGAALTNRPFIKGMAPTRKLKDNGGNKMELEELKNQNKNLSDKIANMETSHKNEVKQLNDSIAQKDEKIKSLEDENKKLSDEQVNLKKEGEFAVLLSEGKAVPAQKEAYLQGDMLKFAELAGDVKTDTQGNGQDPVDTKTAQLSDDDKEKKVRELAQKKLSEKQASNMAEAVGQVLSENPELA